MKTEQSDQLLNSISDALMALDSKLVVTFFNDAAESMLGRKREEILGRQLFDGFPEARGSVFEVNYRKALSERRALSFEAYFDVEPYRNWYDVRVYPTDEGICIFFQVSTALRQLEQNLKKVNEGLLSLGNDYQLNVNTLAQLAGEILKADFSVYRALKGNSLAVVGSWNIPEVFAKTEAPQSGICSQLLFGSEDSHMLVPDLPNSDHAKMDAAFCDSGLVTYLGHVIKTGDVRSGVLCVCYRKHVSPSEDDLELLKVIASALGNVEMRREKEQLLVNSNKLLQDAMDHLNQAQDEIIKRERLSALGQMVSGIAHDFNNALMPIMGISDLVLSNPELLKDTERLRKDMAMIHHSATLASNTVRSLREFYRPTSAEDFEPVDVTELVSDSVKATEHAWKIRAMDEARPIEVKVVTGPIPATAGNRAGLQDVLSNMILNSVDSMPHGGIITIRAWYEDNNIYISVCDTGEGMTEEVRAHCLEPFFTTKYATGTGMGLARSYGIVSRHGGMMTVDSVPGKGTEVVVSLPRRTPENEKEESPSVKGDSERRVALKIMVVDDDERTRYLMEKLLEKQAETLTLCSNGSEALDSFKELRHSLVITDKAMPVMDGEVLAERIKAISPATPIIMLTGYGDLMGEAERPPHVDILLAKPVTRQQLYEAIEKATKGR